MDNQFILIGIIVLVSVGIIFFIWQHNSRDNSNRRKEMAKRTDLFSDNYFDTDNSEPPIVDDIVDIAEGELKTDEESVEKPSIEDDEPTQKDATRQSEILIVLYVVARRQPSFNGEDILTTLEANGLKYGKMDIFHHYGIGEIKVRKPVFSVANIVAPGTLNPEELVNSITPGLALFMRLPGPFGGRVAFELMLNHAERFAEALDGIVEDERHALINQQKITALRERIANFEQRTVSLAMLKQFS